MWSKNHSFTKTALNPPTNFKSFIIPACLLSSLISTLISSISTSSTLSVYPKKCISHPENSQVDPEPSIPSSMLIILLKKFKST